MRLSEFRNLLKEKIKNRKELLCMKDDFSMLIQNRTEFEKGNPATVFLSLPATKEELHEAMKALNITADNPQDFFLNGYSTANNRHIEIPSDWIRDGDIDKINFLAARLEEMTPEQLERLDAVMHSGFKPESLDKLIDHTYNTDFCSYVPGILSYKELGDYFLNDSGKVQMPKEWKAGIDKESSGFNAAFHEDGKLTDSSLSFCFRMWCTTITARECLSAKSLIREMSP